VNDAVCRNEVDPSWLVLLAELGRRATADNLDAVTAGLGPVTLRMPDDIHVSSTCPGITAIAVHRRTATPTVLVSLSIDPDHAVDRAALGESLHAGQPLSSAVDQIGERPYSYRPPPSWGLPDGSQIIATFDGRDHLLVLAIEVVV
jgi:hypothetical protein